MGLIWLITIFLIANLFFTNLFIDLPFRLFQWLGMGVNLVLVTAVIAGVSWLIGKD